MATLLNTYYTYYNGSGNNSPLAGGDWRCYFKVYLDSQDIAGNYSAMHVDTYIQFANQPSGATSRSWIFQNIIDGVTHGNTMPTGFNQTPNDWLVYAPPAGNSTKYLATEYMNVYHGSDGTKNVSMYFKGGRWTSVGGTPTYYVMASGTWYYNLPTIPRYAAITSFNATVNSPTNINCSWSTDKTVSAVYYSTDGGSNWSASVGSGTSGSFNISGLATNTTYNIMLKVTAGDSGLQTTSGSLYRTTWYLSTTAFSNFNLGTNFTANVTRADGSITHNLEVYCKNPSSGDYTLIKTYYDVATSQEISFTSGELATIYALVPNRNDVSILITTVTKIGSTVYGYTWSYQTCYVVDANPIFTDFAFEDTNPTTLALTGDSSKFIRGYSNAQITVSVANKAVAQKGATMSTYSFENAGLTTPTPKAYSAVASVVETLNGVLNANLVVRATDSRGNNTIKTKTIGTFINYTAPVISARTIYRTDNVDDETTLTFSGTYNDWSGLSVSNTIYNAKYRYKEVGGAWSGYTNLTLATNASGTFTFNDKINGDLGASGFTTTKTFEIEITITDKLSSVVYSGLILNSAQPLLWKFKGLVGGVLKSILGIGKKPDTTLANGSIDIAGDLKVGGTGKIGTYDILTTNSISNVLNGTSTSKALSEAKGKALNDLITTINGKLRAKVTMSSTSLTTTGDTQVMSYTIPANTVGTIKVLILYITDINVNSALVGCNICINVGGYDKARNYSGIPTSGAVWGHHITCMAMEDVTANTVIQFKAQKDNSSTVSVTDRTTALIIQL